MSTTYSGNNRHGIAPPRNTIASSTGGKKCVTIVNMLRTVLHSSVALSVMASLVSSDTTRDEPPFVQEMRRSL
jgi:hypothetical protein